MGLKISVIIPTLNDQRKVAELLAHLTELANQMADKSELELIVSDGGSQDDTLEVCTRYPVTLVNSLPGRGMQLNNGAAKARGEFFLFLHADSAVSGEMFEQLADAAERDVKWGCFTLGFTEKSCFFTLLAWCSSLRARLLSSCYGDQGIFCQRGLFRQVGGFPEIPLMEDLVFSRKMRRLGKATLLSTRLVTSPRRFLEEGMIHTVIKIQVLKLLFYLGVSPVRLAKMYYRGEGG